MGLIGIDPCPAKVAGQGSMATAESPPVIHAP
jgi:hypothetical protein